MTSTMTLDAAAQVIAPDGTEWPDRLWQAAATLGRKGGASTSAAKRASSAANGRSGGRGKVLGTIRLEAPGHPTGRILWLRSTGEIRVAEPGQTWPTAEDACLGAQMTLDAALQACHDAWADTDAGSDWQLELRDFS